MGNQRWQGQGLSMVTEEEAVEIATRLVQEKVKEPWKFNSVHLVDPLELIRTATWMTPYDRHSILSTFKKEWMVLFDVPVGGEGMTSTWMSPGALQVGVDVQTGATHIEEFVK